MKRFFFITLYSFLYLGIIGANAQVPSLPNKASAFLKEHFSEYRVVKYKFDPEDNDYKIDLESGHEIKFRADGQWVDVEGEYTPLPKSIIDQLPSGIISYISKNYPRRTILRVKLKDYGYKIELAKSIDLKFTHQGYFIKED